MRSKNYSDRLTVLHPLSITATTLARHHELMLPLFGVVNGRCECGAADCRRPGKHPRNVGGLHRATDKLDPILLTLKKLPRTNLGWVMGGPRGIFAIDIDGEAGERSLRHLEASHGPLPPSMEVATGNGRHIFFYASIEVGTSVGRLGPGLDVRGAGSYVVAANSTHVSGKRYRYKTRNTSIREAPDWLLGMVVKARPPASTDDVETIRDVSAWSEAALVSEVANVRAAPEGMRNVVLNTAAFKLGQLMDVLELSSQRIEQELYRAASAAGLGDVEIKATIGSGLEAGRRNPRTDLELASPSIAHRSFDPLTERLAKLGETDADLAERFATRFRDVAVFTPGRGYLVYNGKVWRLDDVHARQLLAEQTARAIENEAEYLAGNAERVARARFSVSSLSKGALDRMTELAKPRLVVADALLDADPWLLNLQNGTVDLSTGTFREHRAADFQTKLAAVKFDETASCPRFDAFMRHALNGDQEVIKYVQKAVGLSLTGDVSQHVFFFVYGPSRSGKSTFINLIREILGDYGLHTPTETLLAKSYDNAIPNDLARLAGARMVTAVEANWNKHIDEARIKAITGGEPITARFMRQEYFQFNPAFKLWFVANDFPQVRGTAGAFFERVRVIEFPRTVPKELREHDLPARLREEAPGILNWAIEGYRLFQQEGLKMPDAIREASGLWRKNADHVRKFVDDCLIREPGSKTGSAIVHDTYTAWCRSKGETALGIKAFGTQLEQHDVVRKRLGDGTVWVGVKLRL